MLDMLPVAILALLATAACIWLYLYRLQRNRVWWMGWSIPVIAVIAIIVLVITDLYLQKVFGRLLMPTGLLWLALIFTSIASVVRKHIGMAAVCFGLTLLYTAAGNAWLGTTLMRSLESMTTRVDISTVEPFDAVFVLGGGTELDPSGRAQLGDFGDRITTVARLFFAGKAPILVGSGLGLGEDPRNLAEESRQLWIGLGVPDSAIELLPRARITKEEITAMQALATEKGWTRVALVSSAWHLPRALVHCGNLGFAVTPIPCDWRSTARPNWFLYAIPHQDGFEPVQIACWEWLGRTFGR